MAVVTTVFAVALTGVMAPAANALQPGEWILDGEVVSGKFSNAWGVAVDKQTGDLYVSDLGTNQIFKFNSQGAQITSRGKTGSGVGDFDGNRGVAVDSNGNVYVAETGNNRVQKFDRDLNPIGMVGSGLGKNDGQFNFPTDVAVDAADNVYVSDAYNDRVQKFASNGTHLASWGTEGSGDGELQNPTGLEVTGNGDVLIADTGNDRVAAWSSLGTYLGSFGSQGNGPGQLQSPGGISVDAGGNIFVADTNNARIQKFNGAGTPVTSWPVPAAVRGIEQSSTPGKLLVTNSGSLLLSYREARVPQVTSGLTAKATIGRPYSSNLEASGFPVPVFSVVDDSLPKGLALNGDTVSGVKRKVGTYPVKIQAFNTVGDPVVKSYEITFGKASSVVKMAWSTKHPKVKKTYTVKVHISAPETTGLSRTGNVKFYYGSKRVKTVKISKADHGVEMVRLPAFTKKGKKKVTVKYFGNSQLKGKTYVTYVHAQ